MPLFGYNDDNGNPSEPYNLQWGLDRRRATPAAPAQQAGNSPEVERALAMARHQVQLEKERQARVQAEEIQKRIQAGILKERAERAKARQAQAARKKQQQQNQQSQNKQQPQTQTQQPQTQTQQPQTQTQSPATQPQTQTQQPQTQTQQPQAPAESEGDRRLRELQERDQRMLRLGPQGRELLLPPPPANQQPQGAEKPFFGNPEERPAPGQPQAQPQTQPQTQSQPPANQEFDPGAFFGPVGTSPMNSGLSEGDRRLRELQERDQRMLNQRPQGGDIPLPPSPTNQQPRADEMPFFGNPEERPVSTNQQPQAQPQIQPQAPAESEGDRRLRELQERDQRLLNQGPQGSDSNLLGWLWNKITGPNNEEYASQSMSTPSEAWRYESPADLVNPPTPDGRPPEQGFTNRFFDDVGTSLENKWNWFTSPPAEPDPRRDLFGPVGTSPMNGGPGVDPNAPYGPLPGNADDPGSEWKGVPEGTPVESNMPVDVDTGPNMDPGIMAPGSEPSNPTPGIQTLPNMIPETPAFADPRADLFGPVGTSPMNGGPGVDPNAPYGPLPGDTSAPASLPAATPEQRDLFGPVGTSPMNGGPGVDPNAPYGPLPGDTNAPSPYPAATQEQRDFFGPVGTSPMNGYQETFDDAAMRAYLKVVNGLDNAYNWGVREVRPRFQQWRKESFEPAMERARTFFDEAPEGLRRAREKQAAEQAEQARRIQEDGYLMEFLREFGSGLGLR